MFAKEDLEKEPYKIEAFNSTYTILPGVFSPKVRKNSFWYAEKVLSILSGKSFLEIGAGSGILAIEVAKRGLDVVATDIDDQAIKNIKLNSDSQNIKIDIRKGDIFQPIKKGEKFDIIFWNHPWIYSEEKVEGRFCASFDYQYESLKRFIKEGKDFLTDNGQLLLGTGSLARIDLITDLAKEVGYEMELKFKEKNPLSVDGNSDVEFYIYSFCNTK